MNTGRRGRAGAVARAVRALGELRGWRLKHEPGLAKECLSCGDDVVLQEDDLGRTWKVHYHLPPDAECISVSRVPRRWALRLFTVLGVSALLRAFERRTAELRTGYCPGCGSPLWDHDGECAGATRYR